MAQKCQIEHEIHERLIDIADKSFSPKIFAREGGPQMGTYLQDSVWHMFG